MRHVLGRLPAISILAALALTACSGGGGVSTLLPSGVPSPAATFTPTTTQATAIVTIGGNMDTTASAIRRHGAATSSGARQPQYVSPSTLGIKIAVSPGTSQAFDVSAGSPLCTAGSPRTCTLSITAAAGSDTFTLTEYDQAPSGGTIPAGAKTLATTTLTQTISSDANNTLNFFVDGIISGVATSGGVTYGSLPADGTAHTYAIALVATDADGNAITAGSSTPYSNPITVTLTESGGTGHSSLYLNGTNVGSSATVSHSTDSLSLHYDGGGSPGYTTSTAISSSGATGTTLQVSPLYVSGSSYLSGTHVTFSGTAQTASMTASEAGAASNIVYTEAIASCGSYMGSSGGGSGASAGVSLTANTAPYSPPTCTVNVYDNLGSTVVLTVTLPTPAQHCASSALGTQLDSNTVSSGSACTLSLSATSGTVYTPSDGSHPASFTVNISEAYDTSAITLSGCNGSNASVSPTSIAGAGSPTGTASGTVTITAVTVNTSCNVTVTDGHGQSGTIAVTVDPGNLSLSGTNSGSTSFQDWNSNTYGTSSGSPISNWESATVIPFTANSAPTSAASHPISLSLTMNSSTTFLSTGDYEAYVGVFACPSGPNPISNWIQAEWPNNAPATLAADQLGTYSVTGPAWPNTNGGSGWGWAYIAAAGVNGQAAKGSTLGVQFYGASAAAGQYCLAILTVGYPGTGGSAGPISFSQPYTITQN